MTRFFRLALMTAAAMLAGCGEPTDPGPTSAPAGEDATVTLSVHHFLSPSAPAHRELIEPWAERVEAQSGGKIQIEIFPSMTMGGKPPELYRQVRDGAADLVWTLIGYTPGVFPRAEVFELPTVHGGSARATNLAIQDSFAAIADDFTDIKPILIHVHAGNAIQLAEQPVTAIEQVQGLKLRTPGRTGAWMIEQWGAEPVGMPVSSLPQALSKGAVDGALIPFEVAASLKLNEMTAHAVEGPDGLRFGTSVFMFAMNKKRYQALPESLRAVIDANSGPALADQVGSAWDRLEAEGKARLREAGGAIHQLDEAAYAPFHAAGEQVVERWIGEANDKGLPGAELVEQARAAVSRHSASE